MKRRARRWSKELATLGLIALVVLAARSSLADHYVVPSSSMEYALLPGDRVFVDKRAYGLRVPFAPWELREGSSPAPGEIVIFDSPESGTRMIKRVVAVGGDEVELRAGRLSVNGRALAAPGDPVLERFGAHEAHLNLSLGGGLDLGPVRVPEGHVLVLGDFRGNSRDGRVFGFLPEDRIYARALAVYLRRGAGLLWERL